ncbi:serine/threonine-protein kinase [Streptomyces sp. NPDC003016]
MEELGPKDPQQIGAYRLLARLGAGGMGQVYLARSDRGRTVAVKLVRQELAEQEEFRARFRQEVAAARRVGGQWTAPVLDADTEAAIPWVATGYVAGPDLQAVISGHAAGHGPLPERSVHILGAGLAHALRDIHAAGLVHRDLKPSNILITIDGPRVIDFGIARALETATTTVALTRVGALVGSPGFMAPEQVRGEPITPACDIFCLGSVLAYAATGRLPFGTADSGVHALMYRIATEPPALGRIPEGLQDLVRACLHKDPTARPALTDILERTRGGAGNEPWLPATLVAHLGRHATHLLDVENPADPGPPGTPGLHAMPTVVTPPTPAPPTPYARPQPHHTPPRPPHPAPPPHPTPPGGYGHPAPQYAYQPPPPEPPPRSGRATAALIAVALVVALGAGGSVYTFMNTGNEEQHTSHQDTRTKSPAPSTQREKTPAPSPTSTAPQDGSIPAGYLGTWISGLDSEAGHSTRRLVIRQGKAGAPVLSLTADGPAEGGGTYHCVFEADLAADPSDGSPLRIGPSRVTTGEPMSSCTPGAATEVTLLPDGRLRRVNTAGGESLTYTRSD